MSRERYVAMLISALATLVVITIATIFSEFTVASEIHNHIRGYYSGK
jgi:hypothetical protein